MGQKGTTLGHYLEAQKGRGGPLDPELISVISLLSLVGKTIAREIRCAGLVDILGFTGDINVQGEAVKKLDRFANDTFVRVFDNSGPVCLLASEEMEKPLRVSKDGGSGKYVLLFDPLDGSSNIDVNGTVGSVFSIFGTHDPSHPDPDSDLLRKGREQVAAGYIIYGPSTLLVLTTGNGVHGFTLEEGYGEFLLSHENIQIPSRGKTYSINQGNYHAWKPGVQQYIGFLQEIDPATGRPYSLRYVGTLVADIHRTLLEGGIFLYPAGQKNSEGKLRLLYEASPMAFVVENSGGAAIRGKEHILDIQPTALHQRVPLIIGSHEDVQKAATFIDGSESGS